MVFLGSIFMYNKWKPINKNWLDWKNLAQAVDNVKYFWSYFKNKQSKITKQTKVKKEKKEREEKLFFLIQDFYNEFLMQILLTRYKKDWISINRVTFDNNIIF